MSKSNFCSVKSTTNFSVKFPEIFMCLLLNVGKEKTSFALILSLKTNTEIFSFLKPSRTKFAINSLFFKK